MRKKILLVSLALLLAIGLGGCFKKQSEKIDVTKQPEKLSDWLKSGKGVICVVNSPEGEVTTKTKGEKVRMDGIAYADVPGEQMKPGSSLMLGDWIYTWSNGKGTKMNIKDMAAMTEDLSEDNPIEEYSWEEWADSMEALGVRYNCREESISDSEFQVPSDVEFVDLGDLLKDLQGYQQNIENSQNDFGSNFLPDISGSENMNQEDIEALLQSLQN